jgi:hypothetical protein
MDYVQLELHNNNFGDTKLKRNYIWGYANNNGWIPLHYTTMCHIPDDRTPNLVATQIWITGMLLATSRSANYITNLFICQSEKTLFRVGLIVVCSLSILTITNLSSLWDAKFSPRRLWSLLLASLPYFEKIKGGVWDYLAICDPPNKPELYSQKRQSLLGSV